MFRLAWFRPSAQAVRQMVEPRDASHAVAQQRSADRGSYVSRCVACLVQEEGDRRLRPDVLNRRRSPGPTLNN